MQNIPILGDMIIPMLQPKLQYNEVCYIQGALCSLPLLHCHWKPTHEMLKVWRFLLISRNFKTDTILSVDYKTLMVKSKDDPQQQFKKLQICPGHKWNENIQICILLNKLCCHIFQTNKEKLTTKLLVKSKSKKVKPPQGLPSCWSTCCR